MKSEELYKKYKRLRSEKSKRVFNRKHGRYGSCKVKGPRWNDEEIGSWKKEKQDTYRSGRTQREFLRGKSRAERLAYFAKLREKWTDAQLAA